MMNVPKKEIENHPVKQKTRFVKTDSEKTEFRR